MKFTRRNFNKHTLALVSLLTGVSCVNTAANKIDASPKKAIPLILDTDIGDDLDDTWALMMLLRSPEVDVKLITTGFGNTKYRTRLLGKLLHSLGHADIPIGIGLDPEDKVGNQSDWLGEYQLEEYPGEVHEDGIQVMIDTINTSIEPVTLLCIGPVMNIAEALRRDPAIAKNARFVGMQGSVYVGYDGKPIPAAEWNVKVDPGSLQKVFAAEWECSITPLDTCGLVQLKGEKYQRLFKNENSWVKILMDNYRIWLPNVTWLDPKPDLSKMSSTLFDTVAVYLTYSQDFLVMESLPLRVTDDGFTVIDKVNGRAVHCATGWQDMAAFEDRIVELITNES
ncbi:MAG: inosine-uridine nucleoside N-ribohydrolase [Planctomycetota bacterium]